MSSKKTRRMEPGSLKKARLRDLFTSFFRIGTFMFGGGYAMYPLLEREIVTRRKWLSEEAMADIFALSQVIPGLIGINSAMLVGQRVHSWRGSLAALAGMIAVPFALILILASFLDRMVDNRWVAVFLSGLRPAVAGLLLGTAYKLARQNWKDWPSLAAGVAAMLTALYFKNPVMVILTAVAAGIGWQWLMAGRARKGAVQC